jgi:hypothetical protein
MSHRAFACLLLLVALWPRAGLRAEVATTVEKEASQQVTAVETSDKNVSLTVVQNAQVAGSGQADAELYAGLEGNTVVEAEGESLARIADGFAGAMGIVSINQSPGNNNNQGNMVSFAYVKADGDSLLMARGAAEVLNRNNIVDAVDMARTNVIEGGAFRDFSGGLQINQSAGNLNSQNNILAIAAGSGGSFTLSDAALGQQVAGNQVREMSVLKQDIIAANAFSHAAGIVSVNQSSGCGNNQTNLIVISVQMPR